MLNPPLTKLSGSVRVRDATNKAILNNIKNNKVFGGKRGMRLESFQSYITERGVRGPDLSLSTSLISNCFVFLREAISYAYRVVVSAYKPI